MSWIVRLMGNSSHHLILANLRMHGSGNFFFIESTYVNFNRITRICGALGRSGRSGYIFEHNKK